MIDRQKFERNRIKIALDVSCTSLIIDVSSFHYRYLYRNVSNSSAIKSLTFLELSLDARRACLDFFSFSFFLFQAVSNRSYVTRRFHRETKKKKQKKKYASKTSSPLSLKRAVCSAPFSQIIRNSTGSSSWIDTLPLQAFLEFLRQELRSCFNGRWLQKICGMNEREIVIQ